MAEHAGGCELVEALRALGDPTRLGIVLALRERERCVLDLSEAQGLAQPLVSHHLRTLVDAGLVTRRRAAGYTLYALDPAGLTRARALIDNLLDAEALSAVARPGGNVRCCA